MLENSPITSVRNLGAWFDGHMSMSVHVGKVCSKAFRSLYNIRQIRKFLTPDATRLLIHALVTSHLDYCNSLLYGIPQYQFDRLQRILNAAARVVCQVPRFEHITPSLKKLHWLPVRYRVQFKTALLVYKVLHVEAPLYLENLLQLKTVGTYRLRSSGQKLLVLRTTCKTFGDRAFCKAGPVVRNSLLILEKLLMLQLLRSF